MTREYLKGICVQLDTETSVELQAFSFEFPSGSVASDLGTAYFLNANLDIFTSYLIYICATIQLVYDNSRPGNAVTCFDVPGHS